MTCDFWSDDALLVRMQRACSGNKVSNHANP